MKRTLYLVIAIATLATSAGFALENPYSSVNETEDLARIFNKEAQTHKAHLLTGAPTKEQIINIHDLDAALKHVKNAVNALQKTVHGSKAHAQIHAELKTIRHSVNNIERIVRENKE